MRRSLAARVALVAFCVLGASSLPAFAAPISVSSGNLNAYRSCTLSTFTTGSTAGADSKVQQASPTTNYAANLLNVDFGSAANNRTYISFDLTQCRPAIPATAQVGSAVLRLFATAIPTGCFTEDIFRVTSSWSESTLTWNNQPFGTTVNNPAQGSRTSSMSIGTTCGANNAASAYMTGWNVTTDVQAFVAGTATNLGWMIRMDTENATPARSSTFSNRETNNAQRTPQLIVDFK